MREQVNELKFVHRKKNNTGAYRYQAEHTYIEEKYNSGKYKTRIPRIERRIKALLNPLAQF